MYCRFHLQRNKVAHQLKVAHKLELDARLLPPLLMWVKISNGSEFMQGEPLGCPSVRLMLASDLVNYLCYSGQRYLISWVSVQ